MKERDLSIFGFSNSTARLLFHGERQDDELINGIILAEHPEEALSGVPFGLVSEGIGFFREPGDNWSDEGIKELISGNWIKRNWGSAASDWLQIPVSERTAWEQRSPFLNCVTDVLANTDGPILELAAGPGGGLLRIVLRKNPQVHLIVNDWSFRVLRLWQQFLNTQGAYSNLSFAAFDASRMPLRTESIAAISSVLGFPSVDSGPCSIENSIKEAYRVLRKGGYLYSSSFIHYAEDWSKIPEGRRKLWDTEPPTLFVGYTQILTEAGFVIKNRIISGERVLSPDEGGIAMEAARYGARLRVAIEEIEAIKP